MFKVLILFLLICSVSHAAEKVVIQAGQTFIDGDKTNEIESIRASPSALKNAALKELQISVGDSLTFLNFDKFNHNVHSDNFDLKAQAPNEIRSHKFETKGSYEIRCAIHPKMKFKVLVK